VFWDGCHWVIDHCLVRKLAVATRSADQFYHSQSLVVLHLCVKAAPLPTWVSAVVGAPRWMAIEAQGRCEMLFIVDVSVLPNSVRPEGLLH
jgi:hypothetical protein